MVLLVCDESGKIISGGLPKWRVKEYVLLGVLTTILHLSMYVINEIKAESSLYVFR